MAMSKLQEIMDIFKMYNKEDIPVAIIQNGTTKNEKMVIGTVNDIAYKPQYAQLSNPGIIVVGKVVKFHRPRIEEVTYVNALRQQVFVKNCFEKPMNLLL